MADEQTRNAAQPATPVLAHLVYLDVDDEITSAAARIRTTEAPQITLVLPYGSRLATSRINFRLLAREATERGKRLDIVTGDASARALAAAAGLPVHASVAAFEAARGGSGGSGSGAAMPPDGASANAVASAHAVASDAETAGPSSAAAGAGTTQLALPELVGEDGSPTRVISAPRRDAPRVPIVGPARPPIPPRLAIGAGVGVVIATLVIGLLALQLLPAATIVLHPRSQAVGPIQLTVEARADATAPDPANLVIPAQRFTYPLEASQTFPATGTKVVDAKATGNVTFSNFDTGSSNRIEAGSIVKTKDGIEFATLADVTLPNATIQFPFTIVPSTSTVGVEAIVAGPEGNVGNNTITVVPKGENRRLLQVTNVEATSGGAHTEVTVVSQEDIATAQLALEEAVRTSLDAQVEARTGVPVGVTVYDETATVGEITPSVDPATLVDTEAADFELGATAEGSVLGVDQAPIEALVESRLETDVTEGWTLAEGSAAVALGVPTVLDEVISFPVTVHGQQVHDVDQAKLLADIRGLGVPEARTRLEAFGDASISLWPDWVTTIPTNADRIDFTVGAPQPAPSPTP
jgi:hypothetical protein